jgi:hypothetical protein
METRLYLPWIILDTVVLVIFIVAYLNHKREQKENKE